MQVYGRELHSTTWVVGTLTILDLFQVVSVEGILNPCFLFKSV